MPALNFTQAYRHCRRVWPIESEPERKADLGKCLLAAVLIVLAIACVK